MTDEEQIIICKEITKACMWGHPGIASVIVDGLQKSLPMAQGWPDVLAENSQAAEREAVGIVTEEKELLRWLSLGYWLCNYQPGELSIFNPRPQNGLFKYVVGPLAEKYGEIHDLWNYRIYQARRQAEKKA